MKVKFRVRIMVLVRARIRILGGIQLSEALSITLSVGYLFMVKL